MIPATNNSSPTIETEVLITSITLDKIPPLFAAPTAGLVGNALTSTKLNISPTATIPPLIRNDNSNSIANLQKKGLSIGFIILLNCL
ncbi:hypothetical protein GBP05_08610 [Pediococcus pentosaceus]|nr:hypothetical protein GBP05_08610 [Pediococcus pentosaceus]